MLKWDLISIQIKRPRMPRYWTKMEPQKEKLSAWNFFCQTFKQGAILAKGLKSQLEFHFCFWLLKFFKSSKKWFLQLIILYKRILVKGLMDANVCYMLCTLVLFLSLWSHLSFFSSFILWVITLILFLCCIRLIFILNIDLFNA